jgi:hypothetical protein
MIKVEVEQERKGKIGGWFTILFIISILILVVYIVNK